MAEQNTEQVLTFMESRIADIIIDKTTQALLDTPPAQWDDRVKRWQEKGPGIDYFPVAANRATMDEVIRRLDDTIQVAARLRSYLDARCGHGCGDQGHANGVKQGNRFVRKIRKALGYTYAGRDLNF